MSTAPLPCPFCGQETSFGLRPMDEDEDYITLSCACGASGPGVQTVTFEKLEDMDEAELQETLEDCTRSWNRRAPLTDVESIASDGGAS